MNNPVYDDLVALDSWVYRFFGMSFKNFKLADLTQFDDLKLSPGDVSRAHSLGC